MVARMTCDREKLYAVMLRCGDEYVCVSRFLCLVLGDGGSNWIIWTGVMAQW